MRDAELDEVVLFGWLRDGDRTAFTADRRRNDRADEKHENEPAEKHQLATSGAVR